MARHAKSERARRAKVTHAEGEFQAGSPLRDAAELIEEHPMAMQMRFWQTVIEVGSKNNSKFDFPLPLELISIYWRPRQQRMVGLNRFVLNPGNWNRPCGEIGIDFVGTRFALKARATVATIAVRPFWDELAD